MNAQQLRNSILQEAIEGRLVPQDPNDEPASVLLERIREKKKRLLKEGKLKKKDLEETPISEDEKPFEIPDSWEWVKLKYIFHFLQGIQIDKDLQSETQKKGQVRFLRIIDYTQGTEPPRYINDPGERFHVKSTDIVMLRYGTPGLPCRGLDGVLANNLFRIMPIEAGVLNNDFVFLFFKTLYFQSFCNSYGVALSAIKFSTIDNVLFPLPPLAEQKRIVAKIEELLPKVEEYGKAQEALNKLNEELPERLKKSVLQEAIEGRLVPQDPNDEPASVLLERIREEKKRLVKEGKLKKKDLEETPISEDEKPFDIPKSWEWVRLNTLFNIFTGKKDANFGDFNGTYDFFTCSNTPIKSLTYSYDGEYLIMPGNGANIGQVIHYKGKFEAYQRTYLLQAYATVSLEYLKYHLIFNWKEYNQSKLYGSAIPYIKLGNLTSYLVALPPLAEQKRIVAKIEEVFAEVDKLK